MSDTALNARMRKLGIQRSVDRDAEAIARLPMSALLRIVDETIHVERSTAASKGPLGYFEYLAVLGYRSTKK